MISVYSIPENIQNQFVPILNKILLDKFLRNFLSLDQRFLYYYLVFFELFPIFRRTITVKFLCDEKNIL